ncbi:MAG: hypothetical protein ACJ76Z_09720 [Thermoleophilaceae bacterium]
MGAVVDRSDWPVVTVAVEEPADLHVLADELDAILGEERPFALSVVAPRDVDMLQRMLWAAPAARRRLRRQRLELAAWCEAAAHVLSPIAFQRVVPSVLRNAELIWGCATLAASTPDEARDLLRVRLGARLEDARRHVGTGPDSPVPVALEAL